MRSRVILSTTLTLAVFASTASAAFGATALTDGTNAQVAQYGGGGGGVVVPPVTPKPDPGPGSSPPPGSGANPTPAAAQPVSTPAAAQPAVPTPAAAPAQPDDATPPPAPAQPDDAIQTPAPSPGETPVEDDVQTARQLEGPGRSQLPFTGFDLLVLTLSGLALLAGGLAARRTMRSTSPI